jgi:hypothetical protein
MPYEFVNTGSPTENTAITYTGTVIGDYEFTIGPAENVGVAGSADVWAYIYGGVYATNPIAADLQALPLVYEPGITVSGTNQLCASPPLSNGNTYSWPIIANARFAQTFSLFAQGTTNGTTDFSLTNPLNAFTNFYVGPSGVTRASLRSYSLTSSESLSSNLSVPMVSAQGTFLAFAVGHDNHGHRDTELYFEQVADPGSQHVAPHVLKSLRAAGLQPAPANVRLGFGVERVVPPPFQNGNHKIDITGAIPSQIHGALLRGEEAHDNQRIRRTIEAREIHQGLLRIRDVRKGTFAVIRVFHEGSGGLPLGGLTVVVRGEE